jgi:hypothetical protein
MLVGRSAPHDSDTRHSAHHGRGVPARGVGACGWLRQVRRGSPLPKQERAARTVVENLLDSWTALCVCQLPTRMHWSGTCVCFVWRFAAAHKQRAGEDCRCSCSCCKGLSAMASCTTFDEPVAIMALVFLEGITRPKYRLSHITENGIANHSRSSSLRVSCGDLPPSGVSLAP